MHVLLLVVRFVFLHELKFESLSLNLKNLFLREYLKYLLHLLRQDITPSPVYPALHVHINEPSVFIHVANVSRQLSCPSTHSLLSVEKEL